ncbi:STAS domain-containing protein [Streptomyces sp. NPDC093970]|uniref:STAS domain-containing protein n=1 Tax=Streptomyces sp. NPDC093970 TaxID=3155076 RepID=UPI0034471050
MPGRLVGGRLPLSRSHRCVSSPRPPAWAVGRRLVRLVDAGPRILEVDLSKVTYLSPDGCTAPFMALRTARAHGTQLVVTHADERTLSILEQVGLARVLPIRPGGDS